MREGGPRMRHDHEDDHDPRKTIRAERMPPTKMDEAMDRFHTLINEGKAGGDAFNEVTAGWKDPHSLIEALEAAGKISESKPYHSESASYAREHGRGIAIESTPSRNAKTEIDEQKVVHALGAFNERAFGEYAMAHQSDMRFLLEDIAKSHRLTKEEELEVALRAINRYTPVDEEIARDREADGDAPHDISMLTSDEKEIYEHMIKNTQLITREQRLDELTQAAQTPEELHSLILKRFKGMNARMHVNEDGTTDIFGDQKPRRRGRRRSNENQS